MNGEIHPAGRKGLAWSDIRSAALDRSENGDVISMRGRVAGMLQDRARLRPGKHKRELSR
jgi:hypothetical protein